MKKHLKYFLVLMFSLTIIFSLSSCNKEEVYTVSFETDSELVIEEQKVIKGEMALKPIDPVKDGFKFLGWFKDNEEWKFELYPVVSNLVLKAKYEKIYEFSMDDLEVTYDGKMHPLKINEELPEGFKVEYFDNDKVNAGTHEVSALITDPQGKTKLLKANLIIKKAEIKDIIFDSYEVTYDGKEHELLIQGDLPEGVSVKYLTNSATNAGTYEAMAILSGSNYETLELKANLVIKKAVLEGLTLEDKEEFYTGRFIEMVVSGKIPDLVSISYENNIQSEIGTYEVTATITSINYETLVLKATLKIIKKKEYTTIKEAMEEPFGSIIAVRGLVVAANMNSYILTDGTDEIYVYTGSTNSLDKAMYHVGDEVIVKGEYNNYYNTTQIKPTESRKVENTIEDKVKTYPVSDPTFLNNYISTEGLYDIVKVKVVAKLAIEGNFFNLYVPEFAKKISLNTLPQQLKDLLSQQPEIYDGYEVYLTGYNSVAEVLNSLFVSNSNIKPDHSLIEITSIKDVINAKPGERFTIKGVVTATQSDGTKPDSFVISDNTGSIFCYEKVYGFDLGYEVTLEVTKDERDGIPQIRDIRLFGAIKTDQKAPEVENEIVLTALDLVYYLKNLTRDELVKMFANKWLIVDGYLTDGTYTNLGTTRSINDTFLNLYYNHDLSNYKGYFVQVLGFVRGVKDKVLDLQLLTYDILNEPTPIKTATIKEVIDGRVGDTFRIKGVISATQSRNPQNKNSFVISDSTGSIFCYDKVYAFSVGDEVTLEVMRGENLNFPRIQDPKLVGEIVSGKDASVKEEMIEITAEELKKMNDNGDDLSLLFSSRWVKITGTLLDGEFVNLGDKNKNKVADLYSNIDLKNMVFKEVEIIGFARERNTHVLKLQVKSVKEVVVTPEPVEDVIKFKDQVLSKNPNNDKELMLEGLTLTNGELIKLTLNGKPLTYVVKENVPGYVNNLDSNFKVIKAGSNLGLYLEKNETGYALWVSGNKEETVEKLMTIEFSPNENWKKDNARFAAYVFNKSGASAWYDLTLNEKGNYEFSFDSNLYDTIIICRMNSTTKENNWDNKWNQTADLKLFTETKNHYTLKEGIWDKEPEKDSDWQ